MKLRNYFLGLLAMSAMVLTSCGEDTCDCDPIEPFVEAPKCDGTVIMRTHHDGSRATSTIDPTYDNLTATRCDAENIAGRKYFIVSYHGRNKAQIGMVQIRDAKTDAVTDELFFDDSRVNYVQSCSNGAIYIGVDRQGRKDETLCGIVAVMLDGSGKFVLPGGESEARVAPYKVNGLSVNCMKLANNNALVVASAGNEGLDNLGESFSKSGFTKFETAPDDPTKLSVKIDETDNNYRAYWVSYNDYTNCSSYTYRRVEGDDLVFYLGLVEGIDVYKNNNKLFANNTVEVEVYRQKGDTNNYGRYCTCTYKSGGKIYVIASTGTKEGGARVFYYDRSKKTLTLTDIWRKAVVMTSTMVTKVPGQGSKPYAFAACSTGGMYKLWVREDGRLIPEAKYISDVAADGLDIQDEDAVPSSINYVQDMSGRLNVCAGYAGFMTFTYNDSRFVPCDERKDFELE